MRAYRGCVSTCCSRLLFKSLELIGKKCTRIKKKKVLEEESDLENPVVL